MGNNIHGLKSNQLSFQEDVRQPKTDNEVIASMDQYFEEVVSRIFERQKNSEIYRLLRFLKYITKQMIL